MYKNLAAIAMAASCFAFPTHAQKNEPLKVGFARDVARRAAFRHARRRDARKVSALVVPRVGRGDIGRGLVAGDRLEPHAREILRDQRVHRFGSKVPKSVQEEVLARQQDIASGKLKPFAGPICDNGGRIVLAKGQAMTDAQILDMKFLVSGVQGKIAQ